MDTLAHRLAITEQLGRYCLTFDSHDADGWAAIFTDDGVFEVRLPPNPDPIFQARGAEQLRAFAANAPPLPAIYERDLAECNAAACFLRSW